MACFEELYFYPVKLLILSCRSESKIEKSLFPGDHIPVRVVYWFSICSDNVSDPFHPDSDPGFALSGSRILYDQKLEKSLSLKKSELLCERMPCISSKTSIEDLQALGLACSPPQRTIGSSKLFLLFFLLWPFWPSCIRIRRVSPDPTWPNWILIQ